MYTVYRRNDAVEGLTDPIPLKEVEKLLEEDGMKSLRLRILAEKQESYKGLAFSVCEITGAHGFCDKAECDHCEGMTVLWVKRHFGF